MTSGQLVLIAEVPQASPVPSEVRLFKWGENRTKKGNFIIDEIAARGLIAEFESHGADKVWDFEHQSIGGEYSAPDGRAPAAGWIKKLVARRGDGVYALVEWTAAGREALESRAYRYFSPYVNYNTTTGRATSLHSVALVNLPATIGAEPLVTKDDGGGESVSLVLGLRADADHGEIIAAINRLKTEATEAKQELARIETDSLILDAKRSGKVVEATEAWARKLIASDRAAYDEWIKTTPVIRPQGQTTPPRGLEFSSDIDRTSAIRQAVRQFRASGGTERLCCSMRGYVDAFLGDKQLAALKDTEAEELASIKA